MSTPFFRRQFQTCTNDIIWFFSKFPTRILIKDLLWSPLIPPNSLQHSPHHNFTIPLPFWSQDFKLQRWSSSDILVNFFFNFSTITKYFSIISYGIIIDFRFDSMTELFFALIINDVGGICSMDRFES